MRWKLANKLVEFRDPISLCMVSKPKSSTRPWVGDGEWTLHDGVINTKVPFPFSIEL
jgi:hypothetical protein